MPADVNKVFKTKCWKQKCLYGLLKTDQIKRNFNCNFKKELYFIECRVCSKQYNGSTVTKSRARANNYKSTHLKFRKEQKMSNQARNQKRFHEHYLQNDHDPNITIIDHAETEKSLKQKELYWYHKLKTYAPFVLNERDAYAAYQTRYFLHSLDLQISITAFIFPKCFICCYYDCDC